MFDPSKMDPKVLMELSQLVQQLPPEKLNRMQTMMHNMMAGYDVSREMEEFEKSLPPGFREKLVSVMGKQPGFMEQAAGLNPKMNPFGTGTTPTQKPVQGMAPVIDVSPAQNKDLSLQEARMTILRAVADGQMSPEEAERLLFNA